MLNNGGPRIVAKILTDDKTLMSFYYVPTYQESRLWIRKDASTPTMAKKERAITKVIYASFFSGTKLVKVVELKNQRTVTANWHTTKRVPAVLESINIRELMLCCITTIHVHAVHSRQLNFYVIKVNTVKVIKHLPPMWDS